MTQPGKITSIGTHTINRWSSAFTCLSKDMQRNGYAGIGKPEPLKANLQSWWSRRIDAEHRLVYRICDDVCQIIQCKGHYED